MNFRVAYTAVLVNLPPAVVGVVGMLAGFLGGGLPALKLHGIGLAAEGVENGMRWGGVGGGAAAIAVGLVALVGLRWFEGGSSARRAGVGSLAACAPVGFASVCFGGWAGPVLAGADRVAASAVLASSWWAAWPVVVASLAMAAAVGLAARRAAAPKG